jgi:hypothetical protein
MHSLTNRACLSHLEPSNHDTTGRRTASRVTSWVTAVAIVVSARVTCVVVSGPSTKHG